jgi:hypothetical protein
MSNLIYDIRPPKNPSTALRVNQKPAKNAGIGESTSGTQSLGLSSALSITSSNLKSSGDVDISDYRGPTGNRTPKTRMTIPGLSQTGPTVDKTYIKKTYSTSFEDVLNEGIGDPVAELASLGGKIASTRSNVKPRYKKINYKLQKTSNKQITNYKSQTDDDYGHILDKINEAIPRNETQKSKDEKRLIYHSAEIDKWTSRSDFLSTRSDLKKKPRRRKFFGLFMLVGIAVISVALINYGFSLKNKIVMGGTSAAQSLEGAEESLRNFDFVGASNNFQEAYEKFVGAGEDLGFLGASFGKLIYQLADAGDLIEAGKLISEAGKNMSDAVARVGETSSILGASTGQSSLAGLQDSLILAQGNFNKAQILLADVDESLIPEDNREEFNNLKSTQFDQFKGLIDEAIDYTEFIEDLTGIYGQRRYLVLFQNNSELRPTGGFPGSYAIATFEKGGLKDLFVDDIYNLDGQLKDLVVPPAQMQHITPNWGARDANWFIDFPKSADKVLEFFRRVRTDRIDGVIALNPNVIAGILDVVGPIESDEYEMILDRDNFLASIQEVVEYGDNREQPKTIIVDLAPLLLEKLNTANPNQWLAIFNVLVAGLEEKDILMSFKDLNLKEFALAKGFSGEIKNTDGDYLMVNFSNIKGSKTDAVTKNYIKLNTSLSEDSVRHKLLITRKHEGGSTDYGFYNRPNSSYVRVLVPKGAKLIRISGNDYPDYKPLIDYSSSGFRVDDDLKDLESSVVSQRGVDVYEESGMTGFGFWLITNPGDAESVELEYEVPVNLSQEYGFYVQKQSGVYWDNFNWILKSDDLEIKDSSPVVDRIGDVYIVEGNLETDFEASILFK